MRLSARRANDSRRPALATGIVGGNGGVDMLKIYIHSYKIHSLAKFIALLKLF